MDKKLIFYVFLNQEINTFSMQNQAPALRHFSQFSNQGSGTRRDFFVTHHASNDDTPQSLTG
jgi:hypothetical protein